MNDGKEKLCTFEAAGRLFGVPLMDIKEVTAEINCTRIPHAPPCVRGYVNIRGQIILGLDLRQLLKLPNDEEDQAKRLVIFKSTVGPAFGLFVDEVGEIESVTSTDFHHGQSTPAETSLPGPSNLVDRVCRLPDRLLVVLNPRKFLPVIENELSESSTS